MANPQQLMETLRQRPQVMLAGGLALVLILGGIIWGVVALSGGGGKGEGKNACEKIRETDRTLAKTDGGVGKAIEIQALMAREGIRTERLDEEGGKASISLQKEATYCDRDQALVTLVQSGLMDKNIGLEAFDKGDLTASREEKNIKLIRAQQGELARLIRKIDPIEDASVSLSIPEPSIFSRDQQAKSASVQVTIPSGSRLERDKVRAIINLMVGSVQGLDAKHVALSDTNGNTYNSVLDPESQMNDRIEEQDTYMKQKVANQLDRLVGPGNYVVTVSTQLREAPQEIMTQRFDPNQSAIATRQKFSENLNAKSGGTGAAGGIASSFVPNELQSAVGGQSSSARGYQRTGEEVSYANTKTQTLETHLPGMVEDISIAVTLDEDHFPMTLNAYGQQVQMDTNDLKRLIASAASPKVALQNVSLAKISFRDKSPPVRSTAISEPEPDNSWMVWAAGGGLILVVLLFSLLFRGKPQEPLAEQHQQEIRRLQEFASQQQQQLQAAVRQTQLLMESQQRQPALAEQAPAPAQISAASTADAATLAALRQTLSELRAAVDEEDDLDAEALNRQVRSWIESS